MTVNKSDGSANVEVFAKVPYWVPDKAEVSFKENFGYVLFVFIQWRLFVKLFFQRCYLWFHVGVAVAPVISVAS